MQSTQTLRVLAGTSAVAIALATISPAFAAGTTAGSTIQNVATVNYQVGGIAQNSTTASDTLTVDRKVNVTVAEVGTATTQVTPGQASAVTTFTVTNNSNAPLDFSLAASQIVGGTAAHGGTDSFDAVTPLIYVDTNTSGVYDAGDTLVTFLDELAADGARTVFVVSNIPLGLGNGAVADINLTATGREAGAAGLGAALVQTTTANTAGMDTVFADVAGYSDAARDAAHSARDDYTVFTAALTVAKFSTIISDLVNGTTNPKAIPGATIEYCIAVTNGASAATATSVAITDPLPAGITYDAAYGVKVNGTFASGVCTAGAGAGTFGSNQVNGTIASLAAGATRTVQFRATIN